MQETEELRRRQHLLTDDDALSLENIQLRYADILLNENDKKLIYVCLNRIKDGTIISLTKKVAAVQAHDKLTQNFAEIKKEIKEKKKGKY
jgi:hypothetical protein